MKSISFALMAIAFVTSSDAITYAEFKKAKTDGSVTYDIVRVYIQGAGDGMSWMKGELNAMQATRVFCQPPKLALDANGYISIMEQFVTKFGEEDALKFSVQGLLLKGLKEVFPCAKE